ANLDPAPAGLERSRASGLRAAAAIVALPFPDVEAVARSPERGPRLGRRLKLHSSRRRRVAVLGPDEPATVAGDRYVAAETSNNHSQLAIRHAAPPVRLRRLSAGRSRSRSRPSLPSRSRQVLPRLPRRAARSATEPRPRGRPGRLTLGRSLRF